MKQEFDANQGHGDHMDCLCGPGNTNEFLSQWIPQSITKSGLIGGTKEPVDCDFGDEMPKKMPMLLLGDKSCPLRLVILLAVNEVGKQNTLVSAYPEFDGAEAIIDGFCGTVYINPTTDIKEKMALKI